MLSIFTRLALCPSLPKIRCHKTHLHLVYQRPVHQLLLVHRGIPNEPNPISGHLTLIGHPRHHRTPSRRLHLVIPNEPNPTFGHQNLIQDPAPRQPTTTLEAALATH
jgi:hypothetical protein